MVPTHIVQIAETASTGSITMIKQILECLFNLPQLKNFPTSWSMLDESYSPFYINTVFLIFLRQVNFDLPGSLALTSIQIGYYF